MKYTQPRFTVPATGKAHDPATCAHPWLDSRGACMHCGTLVQRTDETPEEPETAH